MKKSTMAEMTYLANRATQSDITELINGEFGELNRKHIIDLLEYRSELIRLECSLIGRPSKELIEQVGERVIALRDCYLSYWSMYYHGINQPN